MQTAKAGAALAGVPDPFPGLRPFESDEEPIFRGRQQHTNELLRRLAEHRFLAVVGTSGSGKSSLVRAGLRPALDRGYLAGATSRWRIAITRPGMAPIENLAEALRHEDALGAADSGKLRSSRLGLVETVRDAGLAPGESLLVVADQFEEIFRYQRRMMEHDGGAEAALFVNLLLTAANRPDASIYVVLTMRSDLVGDCAQFPGLPEALSESQYLIPRLTREERRQAIEEPLRLFGATMTPQLVEQLLNDSGDEVSDPAAGARYRGGAPDPLPVLQHALMRTYLEWKSGAGEGRIDLDHYRKAGRMEMALHLHAENVFAKELDEPGRQWAERIFRCLTTIELGRPVRRPTPLEELYKVVGAHSAEDRTKIDEVLAVLQRRENSFLKVQNDSTVDITHESLIWKWKPLLAWVVLEDQGAELYRDLVKDARSKATWGEPKLSAALVVLDRDAWNADWARRYSESSFEEVQKFLARSRKAARNQQRLRWFGAAATVTLVILGVVLYYSNRQAAATAIARDGLARDLEKRKQDETALTERISGLNASQGATKEERDHIAKAKADLEAQLQKSQEDSQKLTAQAQQSTDLVATVKSLQSRLDQAQKERDDAVQARAAEAKQRQDLETQVASLSRDLENARTATQRPAEPAKPIAVTPAQPAKDAASAGPTPQILDEHAGAVYSVAWSPDGKTLASASGDKTSGLWRLAKFSFYWAGTLDSHKEAVWCVAWSPDGKTLASASSDNTIKLWNPANSRVLRTLQGHKDAVWSVDWSPDGQMLASASKDKTVRIWDAATGRLLRTLPHPDGVPIAVWNPKIQILASGSSDKLVRLFDTRNWQVIATLKGHQDIVIHMAWTADGKTLASASTDKSVRLWGGTNGQPTSLLAVQDYVESLAWSRDGKLLALASHDGTVKLWAPPATQILATLRGHQAEVRSVAWSPDGKTLASASSDKTIRLWPVADLLK